MKNRKSGKPESEDSEDEEEVVLTSEGGVKKAEEQDVEEAGSSEVSLLCDIRDQNREMIELLRGIKESLK